MQGKETRVKATKGQVVVVSQDNRLRVRFRVGGHRYVLPLGYPDTPDTPAYRKLAKARAAEIQGDFGVTMFPAAGVF